MKCKRGFTLVELVLTVTIIGILFAILIPEYSKVIARARDAQTIGDLAILRMTLGMYYSDHLTYPSFPPPWNQPAGYSSLLENALVPLYIRRIPDALLDGWYHPATNRVFNVWNMTGLHEDGITDTGDGWRYDANPFDISPSSVSLSFGDISVLCYHVNAQSKNWQGY